MLRIKKTIGAQSCWDFERSNKVVRILLQGKWCFIDFLAFHYSKNRNSKYFVKLLLHKNVESIEWISHAFRNLHKCKSCTIFPHGLYSFKLYIMRSSFAMLTVSFQQRENSIPSSYFWHFLEFEYDKREKLQGSTTR